MKKKLSKLLVLLAVPMLLMGCGGNSKDSSAENIDDSKLNVIVSINPLKEFTQIIGGDKVTVDTLVPENAEPHDFEFKPKDIERVINSKVFIYNGLGMEHWISDLTDQLSGKNVQIVDSSKNANIIKDGNRVDPHIWLSLKEAINQGNNIKDALVEIDSANKEYYEANYNNFKTELENLYNEYKTKFDGLKTKDFVTSHSAFGYLCRDFDLTQQSISDIFGEGEDRPQDKANLIKFCKDNNITTIFSEGTETQKSAESLADEIGGKVEPLYTMETKVEGKNYIETMKYNLETIYSSMK